MKNPSSKWMDRRRFLATTGLGSMALMQSPAKGTSPSSETLVGHFFESLSPEQKQTMVLPFAHPLRKKVDANWHITPARVGESFTKDQQHMIGEIFRGLHSEEFVDEVIRHLDEDGGGIANYSVALFGEPGRGAFEFVLTGRHCTVRCDGDSVEGAAFGGPIFYGHAAGSFNEKPDHPGNVYWYQALRANEVFQALDGKQRSLALLGDPRREQGTKTVELKREGAELAGLSVAEMSPDQKQLVDQVLADLLLPFREADRREAMNLIRSQGGIDALSMSFFKNQDIGNDGTWDVWQLESPAMLWYFRGAPHVHTWVNIRRVT